MHVHGSRGPVKKIFAGLQRLFAMEPMPEDKGQTTSDHARSLQFSGNPASRVSRAEHYEFLPLRRNGHQQRPRHPAANSDDGKQQEYQERTQVRNSLDEDESWVVSLWSLDLGRREMASGVGRQASSAAPAHTTPTVIPSAAPSRACAVRASRGTWVRAPMEAALRRQEPRSLDNLSSRSARRRSLGMTMG